MKHYREVTVPQRTKKVLDKIICDLCNVIVGDGLEVWEVDEVTVSRKTGWNYPDGGNGDTISVDLCGKCFNEKLLPFLKSEGATVTETEHFY
jgi:hypothetical protein